MAQDPLTLRKVGRTVSEQRIAIRGGRFDGFLHVADYNLLRQDDQSVIEETAAANVGVILAHVYLAGLLAGQDPAERPGGRAVPPRYASLG